MTQGCNVYSSPIMAPKRRRSEAERLAEDTAAAPQRRAAPAAAAPAPALAPAPAPAPAVAVAANTEEQAAQVLAYADPYVPEPPYCTYRLRVPASCVAYVPAAQAAAAPRHVHRTRTSPGCAVRTAYRGTTGAGGTGCGLRAAPGAADHGRDTDAGAQRPALPDGGPPRAPGAASTLYTRVYRHPIAHPPCLPPSLSTLPSLHPPISPPRRGTGASRDGSSCASPRTRPPRPPATGAACWSSSNRNPDPYPDPYPDPDQELDPNPDPDPDLDPNSTQASWSRSRSGG